MSGSLHRRRTCRGFVPSSSAVTSWGWESHHGALNQAVEMEFPAPPLADHLGLRSGGGSADLLDPAGRIASLYRVSAGGGFESHYLYLRRDLLEDYLATRGLQLVRPLSGKRRLEDDARSDDSSEDRRNAYTSSEHVQFR